MTFEVSKVHPTFGAEIQGVNLSLPLTANGFDQLRDCVHEYGVVVLRKANLPDDQAHVEFSRRFGEVERSKWRSPHMRSLPYPEVFDISNLDENGQVVKNSNEKRITAIRGNSLWHSDGSFNPRRTSYAILRAVKIPPPHLGGYTEYADARQAYGDLPETFKDEIDDLVVVHSFMHNRKTANPTSPLFRDINVLDHPLARHKLVTVHEPSRRKMLYVTSYAHHIEGMPVEEGQKLLKKLMDHITQPKYVFQHHWASPGDIAIWDNTAVLHRATAGEYEGKCVRDMRRTCVFDSGSQAYGLNDPESAKNQANSS